MWLKTFLRDRGVPSSDLDRLYDTQELRQYAFDNEHLVMCEQSACLAGRACCNLLSCEGSTQALVAARLQKEAEPQCTPTAAAAPAAASSAHPLSASTFGELQKIALAAGISSRDVNMAVDKDDLLAMLQIHAEPQAAPAVAEVPQAAPARSPVVAERRSRPPVAPVVNAVPERRSRPQVNGVEGSAAESGVQQRISAAETVNSNRTTRQEHVHTHERHDTCGYGHFTKQLSPEIERQCRAGLFEDPDFACDRSSLGAVIDAVGQPVSTRDVVWLRPDQMTINSSATLFGTGIRPQDVYQAIPVEAADTGSVVG